MPPEDHDHVRWSRHPARIANFRVRLRGVQAAEKLSAALDGVVWEGVLSRSVDRRNRWPEALRSPPPEPAVATVAERLADRLGAHLVADEPRVLAITTRV